TSAPEEFLAQGELEVIENHLRIILKSYKAASKKKAPQSAWKPVYAGIEALTIFLQTKSAWISSPNDAVRAQAIFAAYGAAWIGVAEHLTELGSFGENSYPSVRCAVNTALNFGNETNEKAGKKLSDWPAKLEAVWTGTEYVGDKKKKKPANAGGNNDEPKKKSKKKKDDFGSDEDEDSGKKKKAGKKSTVVVEEAPSNPFDFEECITRLKADRKQIGGTQFDIETFTEDMKQKLAVAAN
ncbi:hypothetical protein HK100_010617, partial [Physocladia obscura]